MSASGLTPRTMELLRRLGYQVGKTEHYHFYSKQSSDLFGVIDLIAMKPGVVIGVQSTSYNCRKDHLDKILTSPLAKTWVETGAWFWMISWKKVPERRGSARMRWVPIFDFININSEWRLNGDSSGEDSVPSQSGGASGSGNEEDLYEGIGDWNRGDGD